MLKESVPSAPIVSSCTEMSVKIGPNSSVKLPGVISPLTAVLPLLDGPQISTVSSGFVPLLKSSNQPFSSARLTNRE